VFDVVPAVVKMLPRAWSKVPFLIASWAACDDGCDAADEDVDWADDGETGCRPATFTFGFLCKAAARFGAVTSMLGRVSPSFPDVVVPAAGGLVAAAGVLVPVLPGALV
jgi:hypothetical protein